MADLVMDIGTISGKSGDLSKLNDTADSIYSSVSSGALGTVKAPISGLKTIVETPLNRYKNGFNNSNTWLSNYISELEALESDLASFKGKNVTTPTTFNGKFEDLFGRATMSVLQTNGDALANYKTYGIATVTDLGNGIIDFSISGNNYYVVNTNGKLMDYYNSVILGKRLYQSTSKKYADQCLGFAYNYAYGLYANDRSINGSTIRNGTSYSKHFTRYLTNSEADFKQKLYEELKAGRPVVVQVNGKKSTRGRHYVTAVGFKNNVTSASDLKLTDILVIDTYDGKIKNTVPKYSKSGRYIAKGTEINSGRYNYGYELYSITS